MRNIKAIARKEFLHVFRDGRTLRLIILMPIIQLMIYGYAINTDIKHLATVVYDEDRTYLSRKLVDSFQASEYFDVVKRVASAKELYRALDLGQAKAGLFIPPNFTKDIMAKRGTKVQMLIDGTDSNPANVALNTSQAVVTNFMQQEGLTQFQAPAIDFRPRLWYNPDLKSTFFLVPGLVGLLLQMIIPMITASAIVREKEHGNIEQLLVTPIKSLELMLGKLVPYVPIRGNPITLLVLTFLFLLVCLGIGLLASTIADNQQQAAQLVMFLAVPSILLSGFIFPRETMPKIIHMITYAIPLSYFVIIIRGIILKGLGLVDLLPQIIPLTVIGLGILFLSVKRFHKRLS
jgi:ABC-2 type transport system permease protein